MNHVIKLEVKWKESKLPVLIQHLKCLVDRYKTELEKAIVRREWVFTLPYSHLEVSEDMWFSHMNSASKQKHMKRVFSCKLVSCDSISCKDSVGNQSTTVTMCDGDEATNPATACNLMKVSESVVLLQLLSLFWVICGRRLNTYLV